MIPQEGRGLAIVTARGRVPAGKLAAETDAGNRRTQLPPECPKAQFFFDRESRKGMAQFKFAANRDSVHE
jgi:hypothetical protein